MKDDEGIPAALRASRRRQEGMSKDETKLTRCFGDTERQVLRWPAGPHRAAKLKAGQAKKESNRIQAGGQQYLKLTRHAGTVARNRGRSGHASRGWKRTNERDQRYHMHDCLTGPRCR